MSNNRLLVIVGIILVVVGVWQFSGVVPGVGADNSNSTNSSTPNASGSDEDVFIDPSASESTETPVTSAASPTPPQTATPATPEKGDGSADSGSESLEFQINESYTEEAIAERINEKRSENGLQDLSTSGRTHEELYRMATNHTEAMTENRTLAHSLNGATSADRYRRNGLYDQCRYKGSGDYIETPDNADLEAISKVSGVRNENGSWNTNEDEIARVIVGRWVRDDTLVDTLWIDGPSTIAVSVEATADGEIYTTANVC